MPSPRIVGRGFVSNAGSNPQRNSTAAGGSRFWESCTPAAHEHHERRGWPRRSQCTAILNAASRDGAVSVAWLSLLMTFDLPDCVEWEARERVRVDEMLGRAGVSLTR